MRIAVQADDGDELSICADFISVEQAVVTMEIANSIYCEAIDFDTVTLTTEKARELASALISVADAIDVVREYASHSPALLSIAKFDGQGATTGRRVSFKPHVVT
jgi:hypothetical protein